MNFCATYPKLIYYPIRPYLIELCNPYRNSTTDFCYCIQMLQSNLKIEDCINVGWIVGYLIFAVLIGAFGAAAIIYQYRAIKNKQELQKNIHESFEKFEDFKQKLIIEINNLKASSTNPKYEATTNTETNV